MSGFLTFVAIMFFLGLWIKDSVERAAWKSQSLSEARRYGDKIYSDGRGRTFSVKTHTQVSEMTVYRRMNDGCWHRGMAYRDVNTHKIVDLSDYWSSKPENFGFENHRLEKIAYVNGIEIHYI